MTNLIRDCKKRRRFCISSKYLIKYTQQLATVERVQHVQICCWSCSWCWCWCLLILLQLLRGLLALSTLVLVLGIALSIAKHRIHQRNNMMCYIYTQQLANIANLSGLAGADSIPPEIGACVLGCWCCWCCCAAICGRYYTLQFKSNSCYAELLQANRRPFHYRSSSLARPLEPAEFLIHKGLGQEPNQPKASQASSLQRSLRSAAAAPAVLALFIHSTILRTEEYNPNRPPIIVGSVAPAPCC